MCLGLDGLLLAVLGNEVIQGCQRALLASVKELCVGVLHLLHELGVNRGLPLFLPQLGGHLLNFVLPVVHGDELCDPVRRAGILESKELLLLAFGVYGDLLARLWSVRNRDSWDRLLVLWQSVRPRGLPQLLGVQHPSGLSDLQELDENLADDCGKSSKAIGRSILQTDIGGSLPKFSGQLPQLWKETWMNSSL